MPRLLLLRHATAERASPRESDRDRALTKGGRREAKSIGKVIAGRNDGIDLMLSSDSRRTRETWDGVAEVIKDRSETRFPPTLYEASSYVPTLKAEGGAAKTILLVGHNPTIQTTAIALAENLAGHDGAALRASFPKGALAVLDFDGEWRALVPGQMRLVAFIKLDAG